MSSSLPLSALKLPAFFSPMLFEALDGSNAEVKRQAAQGAGEGLFVLCEEQLAGRGRRGRQWSSPKGNLYCSLLLRPEESPNQAALVSFVAALAVADLAGSQKRDDSGTVALKWPNDVLFNGKKMSGILLESAASSEKKLDWLVVGMGVNLRHFPADAETPATSILAETNYTPSVSEAGTILATRFYYWLTIFREQGFEPIRQAWLAQASGVGTKIRVRLASETLYGIFKGLDGSGALELEDKGKIRLITAGEVFFGHV